MNQILNGVPVATNQTNAAFFQKQVRITENPFAEYIDLQSCSYVAPAEIGKNPLTCRLINKLTGLPATAMEEHLHGSLIGMLYPNSFPCPGGRMVIKGDNQRLAVFDSIDSCNIDEVCFILCHFMMEYLSGDTGNDLTLFLVFSEMKTWTKRKFRRRFWKFLRKVTRRQAEFFDYAQGYSPVLSDGNFSFSFAGISAFIAAMFNDSPRVSRRFGYTCLVFNVRDQFNKLKAENKYDAFKQVVGNREEKLQGTKNKNLSDFNGTESEWRQYDSIDVEPRCPFRKAVKKSFVHKLFNPPPFKSLI